MSVLICPGIHPPQLTQSFLQNLRSPDTLTNWFIFPAQDYPAYSAVEILKFLDKCEGNRDRASPVLFTSFSAGVVGAIGAAIAWQMRSGQVKGFIALDGWGVPLAGNFPIHRLSHDYFTHWSSALLGAGAESFYAEPPVEHLELWRSPQTTLGWQVKLTGCRVRCSAAEFLLLLLKRYEEI